MKQHFLGQSLLLKRLIFSALIAGISSPFFSANALAVNTTAEPTDSTQSETAIFAGGCFWCMEPPFDKLDGVLSTTSGYTSGHKKNPTYQEVSAGRSGHTEAVAIVYDPAKISYAQLLETFWKNIDPVAINAQFCDHGPQYRSGIYFRNAAQEKAARQSYQKLEKNKTFKEDIATEIIAASTFYPAEDYHQDYYQKNPLRYRYYRYACGRDKRLSEIWREKTN